MTLAIFDLDNTLLGGDSDNLWGEFVCERGLVDGRSVGKFLQGRIQDDEV